MGMRRSREKTTMMMMSMVIMDRRTRFRMYLATEKPPRWAEPIHPGPARAQMYEFRDARDRQAVKRAFPRGASHGGKV